MTRREVLPSGNTPVRNDETITLASIAGVLIAALLCSTAALLAVSNTSLAAWAGFCFGALFGLCSVIAAVLLARPHS